MDRLLKRIDDVSKSTEVTLTFAQRKQISESLDNVIQQADTFFKEVETDIGYMSSSKDPFQKQGTSPLQTDSFVTVDFNKDKNQGTIHGASLVENYKSRDNSVIDN